MLSKFVTPEMVEKVLGMEKGSVNPFAFLVMQEMAQGRSLGTIAAGLDISESDLDDLCDSVTGGPDGTKNELWRNGVAFLKSTLIGNQQTIAQGWDALESMTVEVLAKKVQDAGALLPTKDALAIATIANKAVRRHAGEGQGARVNVGISRPTGMGEEDMSLELRSGNLGSIRISLSSRVRAQLEKPVIEGSVNRVEVREMLDLEATRQLVQEK